MQINFWGDSWAWSWAPPELLKSNTISKFGPFTCCLSMLQLILERMGHDLTIFNNPGNSFITTVNNFWNSNKGPVNNDTLHIVFFSSLYRSGNELIEFGLPTDNYNEFIEVYNKTTVEQLQRLAQKLPPSEKLILLGGHERLDRDLFDQANLPTNVMLGSECLFTSMLEIFFDGNSSLYKPLGRWRLCADWVSSQFGGDKVDWHPDLIDAIWDDMKSFDNQLEILSVIQYPDKGHLGYVGQTLLADRILLYIETGVWDLSN